MLFVPKISDYLKTFTDDKVKDLLVKNFGIINYVRKKYEVKELVLIMFGLLNYVKNKILKKLLKYFISLYQQLIVVCVIIMSRL